MRALVSGVHLSTPGIPPAGRPRAGDFLKPCARLDLDTLGQMREKCRRDREEIGQAGISVPWGSGGVFNQAASLRNVTDLLTDAYTCPDVYRALMGKNGRSDHQRPIMRWRWPTETRGRRRQFSQGDGGRRLFPRRYHPSL